jgi:glycosyltransferase involved in cell wall biosynthesis
MTTVSGCTLVRNAVKLRYPLEASILTYYPLCDEVVVAYDPTTDDGTDAFIKDLARRYPKVRPVASPWNIKNHEGGTEITIQSNVAAEACTSDWVLYVQADEAIHEGDYDFIREVVADKTLNGLLFARRSFLGTLDREIPEYYARNLLRLYRNGQGCVIGDGMTCGFYQNIPPSLPREQPRMFNYSRMGNKEEVILRSKCRDNFHISTEAAIEANVANECTQAVGPFDAAAHPGPIRSFYQKEAVSSPTPSQVRSTSPVTLALLMGPGERENLAPFFWQFRSWAGDIVVLDDMTTDGGGAVLERTLTRFLGLRSNSYKVIRAPLNGDFGAARNLLQELAQAPWVLTTAPDERWDPALLSGLPQLVAQLDQDRKLICGFPRANFVDGILVNDIPDHLWTEEGLIKALPSTSWPPKNPDVQYRLMRKEERWVGTIHEQPARLPTHAGQVVTLRDFWILHSKTYARQRKQDSFYKSLGQQRGMPASAKIPAGTTPAVATGKGWSWFK